ncbi:hypothetical protein KC722_00655 [Candidatus Kaiserbacteria bacterium]|nr:hypothetical protein [Candidatus Kaiserbacteria bacterium]MCB9811781.1 hypothetical protein [Candidatus Nomurabacteria bacterium]
MFEDQSFEKQSLLKQAETVFKGMCGNAHLDYRDATNERDVPSLIEKSIKTLVNAEEISDKDDEKKDAIRAHLLFYYDSGEYKEEPEQKQQKRAA